MKNLDKPKNYDNDYYGWSLEQADLLKKGEYKKLDIENLIEEIESLGRSEKRTLMSQLEILLMHMLKKEFQPEKRTRSWDLSIENSRLKAKKTLKENPSLKHKLLEIFEDAYSYARLDAAKETELEKKTFPKKCPWTIEEVLK